MEPTKVRFASDSTGYLAILEIDTPSSGEPMLGRLGRTLFDLRVQTLGTASEQKDGRRRERLWLVDFDGAPLRPRRKFEVQLGVVAALGECSGPSEFRARRVGLAPRVASASPC